MKIRLFFLSLLTSLVIAILITHPRFSVFAADPNSAQVTIIGDSLTARAQSDLQQRLPNAVINGVVSRFWSGGLTALDQIKKDGKLYPTLVFALGTNGGLSSADVDNLLSAAPDSKIILVTVFNSSNPDAAKSANDAINAAQSAHSDRIKIADWYSVAAANPALIDESGYHQSIPEGTQKYADIISSAVSGSSSNAPGAISQTVKSNCVVTKVGAPTESGPKLPEGCIIPVIGDLLLPVLGPENTDYPGYFKMPAPSDGSYEFYSCENRHWGSKELISVLYTVAKRWKQKYPQGTIYIGDLNASGHASHKWGRGVDLSASTNGVDSVANFVAGNYNEPATIELGEMFADTDKILNIWYMGQPVINAVLTYTEQTGRSKGLVMQPLPLHDNHFHMDVKLDPLLAVWEPGC